MKLVLALFLTFAQNTYAQNFECDGEDGLDLCQIICHGGITKYTIEDGKSVKESQHFSFDEKKKEFTAFGFKLKASLGSEPEIEIDSPMGKIYVHSGYMDPHYGQLSYEFHPPKDENGLFNGISLNFNCMYRYRFYDE